MFEKTLTFLMCIVVTVWVIVMSGIGFSIWKDALK